MIPTEPVFCNVATLVIGAAPQYSIFYGDVLREPVRGEVGEQEDDEEAVEAAPTDPAPADSTSTEIEG